MRQGEKVCCGVGTPLCFLLFQAHVASQAPDVPVPFTIRVRQFAASAPPRFNLEGHTIQLIVYFYSRAVMHIKKLKVRPQKSTRSFSVTLPTPRFYFIFIFASISESQASLSHSVPFFLVIDPPVVLCGPQLASMLGCWAATKDVKSVGACREHAQALFECMRTAVRLLFLLFTFRCRKLIF
jgi:hypothetical protein